MNIILVTCINFQLNLLDPLIFNFYGEKKIK